MFMNEKELMVIVGKNLRHFIKQYDNPHISDRALARAAKISPNTVTNILRPKQRTLSGTRADGYPTIEKLSKLAGVFKKCEVWMLMHPDIKQAIKLKAFYDADKDDVTHEEQEQPEERKDSEAKGSRAKGGSNVKTDGPRSTRGSAAKHGGSSHRQ